MISADLIAFANRLADAAGVAIRPHFRTRLDVEAKADASPVTIADRAAETAMRTLIAAERPNDDIIGEEYRSEEHTYELQSLMRISYAVLCLKKKKTTNITK